MSHLKVQPKKMKTLLDGVEQELFMLQESAVELRHIRDILQRQFWKDSHITEGLFNLAQCLDNQYKVMKQVIDVGRQIVYMYEDNEKNLVEENANEVNNRKNSNLDGHSGVFDEKGGYGGNQGDPSYNKRGWKFIWRFGADKELFDFVRGYAAYSDYSDDQIVDLYDRINREGCGYVAFANNIFVEYEGNDAAFERDFGFPMYDKNGDFNYNRLMIDFYASTDDKYYLNQVDGSTALVNDRLLDYIGKENKFREKYGVELWKDGDSKSGRWSMEAMQVIMDEHKNEKIVTNREKGTSIFSLNNRINEYLGNKDVKVQTNTINSDKRLTSDEISCYIDSGKNINIATKNFNLYDEEGNAVRRNVGAHWMTITGTTEGGQYIVSSWGQKYYIHPDELKANTSYLITDITVIK